MHDTCTLNLSQSLAILLDLSRKTLSLENALELYDLFATYPFAQYNNLNPNVLVLSRSLPKPKPNTLQKDPLIEFPFQEVEALEKLQQSMSAAFGDHTLRINYHSNVLPVIGSTGCGKSRLIQHVVSLPLQVEKPIEVELKLQNYLYDFPLCPPQFFNWLSFKFCTICSIKYSVVVFQCFLVSLLERSSVSFDVTDAYNEEFYTEIKNRTEELLNLVDHNLSIVEITKTLVKDLVAAMEKETIFCLFLDQVDTLIHNRNFQGLSFNDPSWNLYRSLRHAARNLLPVLHIPHIPYADRFLLIVTGTNFNLANFCLSDVRVGDNRPAVIEPHELSVPGGLSLPPVLVSPPQLDPLVFFEHEHRNLLEPLSDLLSVGLAISLRPLWIAIFKKNSFGYLMKTNEKILNALKYSSSQYSLSKCPTTALSSDNTVLFALLLTCCLNSTLPCHVLSTLVECSFASVTRVDFSERNQSQEEVFLSVPLVDPLVATCCWNVIMERVRGRPYEFFSSLKELGPFTKIPVTTFLFFGTTIPISNIPVKNQPSF
ncbi:hypothetical protein GEMRC1_013056 [Eukaryota sp. GEM-RC1]